MGAVLTEVVVARTADPMSMDTCLAFCAPCVGVAGLGRWDPVVGDVAATAVGLCVVGLVTTEGCLVAGRPLVIDDEDDDFTATSFRLESAAGELVGVC